MDTQPTFELEYNQHAPRAVFGAHGCLDPVGGAGRDVLPVGSSACSFLQSWKMICMKWNRCGALRVCVWGARFRTKHYTQLSPCWSGTAWARSCSAASISINCACAKAQSCSTLSRLPPRPRMSRKPGTRRCTRRARAKTYFGMKLHIGVDVVSGLVHSLVTTPANVQDPGTGAAARVRWCGGMPAIRASPCTGTSPCGRGCAAPWIPHCGPKCIRFAP